MLDQKSFFNELSKDFDKSIKSFKNEISRFRTGKASPLLLDGVEIDYYGVNTPLKQAATISVPEPRLLLVQPFDKSQLENIERAILNANLGFNPINDGVSIKVPVPAPNEERRKAMAKKLNSLLEQFRVSLRNIRRDGLDELAMYKEEKEITEDEEKKCSEKVQELLKEKTAELEDIGAEKEKEILNK